MVIGLFHDVLSMYAYELFMWQRNMVTMSKLGQDGEGS